MHPENDAKEVEAFLKSMHEIAEEVGLEVQEKVDVTEIISEGRRELPVSYEDNDTWRNLKRLSRLR